MRFCKECGAALKENVEFCKECGTPVKKGASAQTIPQTTAVTKKPLSKKTKKLIIAGVAAVAVLFGGYKLGESLTSKEKKIEKLQTALIEKNEEDLAKILVSTDKRLDVDKDSIQGLMKLINENPDNVTTIIETLTEQAEYYDLDDQTMTADKSYRDTLLSKGLFNLKKNGKTFLYDKYEITIRPVYVSISTNYKDTELKIDGENVATSDSDNYSKKIGPYLPGYYNVKATLDNDYVKNITSEQEIIITPEDDQYFDVYLDADTVTIDSDLRGQDISAKVLINGEETDINPFVEEEFGPILIDGSLKMQVKAEMPWGQIKSTEIPIDDNYISVDFESDETFQKNIIDTVVLSAKEWSTAYTSGDVSKMTTYTKSKNEELKEQIEEAKEYGNFYKGSYLGTTIDLESLNLYKEDDYWKAEVSVQEKYNSDSYYEGESPELEDEENNLDYYLVYDEESKKWLIDDSYSSWYFDGDEEVYEHTEEKPEVLTTVWSK